jgi:hypothetical protein
MTNAKVQLAKTLSLKTQGSMKKQLDKKGPITVS